MEIRVNKHLTGQEINNLSTQKASEADRTAAKDKKDKKSVDTVKSNDKIDISSRGKEVSELIAAIKKLPETRDDRINELKKAIETGNYNENTLKVAEKILAEL